MIAQCRRRLPPQLFTSFAQYFASEGVWCSSKGQEVFGVPNLAILVTPSQAESVFAELWRLFRYSYEDGVIFGAGEELEMGGFSTRVLRTVSEAAPGWEPYLETPGGTLILAPS